MIWTSHSRRAAQWRHASLGSLIFLLAASPSFAQTGAPEGNAPAEAEEEYDPQGVAAMRREQLDDEAARGLFVAAQALYEGGRFNDAAAQFEQAYELSNRASLLFNAYLAYRDAGELNEAIRVLDLYLQADPEAEDHERLSNRLAALRETARRANEIQAAEDAERERLAVEAAAQAAAAEEERQRAEAERMRAETIEAGIGTRRTVGWIMAGGGVAMLIVGGVMAGISSGRFSDLENNCPGERCPTEFDLATKQSRVQRANRSADALLIGGGVVTIAGLLMAVISSSTTDAPPASASCSGDGCRVELRGSF